MDAGHERGSFGVGMNRVASNASLGGTVVVGAGTAPLEVGEALGEVALELQKLLHLLARRSESLAKHLAHALHRHRGRLGLLDRREQVLDLRQREPHVLQLGDPVHACDLVGAVQAEPTVGPHRRQQPHLLVEPKGTHGLAGLASELADLEVREGACGSCHRKSTLT